MTAGDWLAILLLPLSWLLRRRLGLDESNSVSRSIPRRTHPRGSVQ
jgi:hypothetical protein